MRRPVLLLLLALCACAREAAGPQLPEATARARVQVLDDSGAPLVVDVALTGPAGRLTVSTTPDSGWAEFAGLVPGAYTARPLVPPAWRLPQNTQTLDVRTSIVARVTFIAQLLHGSVAGSVIDTQGGMVGLARLELRGSDGSVRTQRANAFGAFLFTRVPLGSYQLLVADSALTPNLPVAVIVEENTTRQFRLVVDVPRDGAWHSEPALPHPRGSHVTVRVGEDVYVFGGERAWTELEPTVERFRAGQWSTVGTMAAPRTGAAGAAIGSRIYLVGGRDNGYTYGDATNTVWIYDTADGTWSAGPAFPGNLYSGAAAVLDGRIHVLGGIAHNHYALDPVGGTWTPRAAMPGAGSGATPLALDGRLYVLLDDVLSVYDPGTDRWTAAPSPERARRFGTGVVHQGRLYFFGGISSREPGGPVPDPQSYDPATGRWSTLRTMPFPRSHFGAAALADGIYLFGGAPDYLHTAFSSTVSRFVPPAF